MSSLTRKFVSSAAVAALAACAAYLTGAWVIIYALRPEHPEIHPARLYREALSHLPVIMIAFVVFQVTALALTVRAVGKISLAPLVMTVAEVSAVIALLHGLLSDLSAFDALWWRLLAVSAPVVIASTAGVVYLRQ